MSANASAWINEPAARLDDEAAAAARVRQQRLTKPPGSLGRLEDFAIQLAACQGTALPDIKAPHITVFAGDHGIVAEGVSAYPPEVTEQMLLNFVAGGAAISVLARETGAQLSVVDVGSLARAVPEGVIADKIAHGSDNFASRPALSEAELAHALGAGQRAVSRAVAAGADFLLFGEMGIGNTSAAAALTAALTGRDPAEICGPGTGLTPEKVQRKAEIISTALALHGFAGAAPPLAALRRVSGHEVAALAGAFVAAAQAGRPVLVDGFICSAAALAALRLNPCVRDWLFFSHISAEPGHHTVLQEIGAAPILDLGMRLGEGSGAAAALPLLKLACRLHSGMATFESAGVSEKERA